MTLAKRRRRDAFDDELSNELSQFRASMPAMSASALGAMLTRAQKKPLPAGNRNYVRIARQRLVSQSTPYGPLVQQMQVCSEMFDVLHPAAWLYKISEFQAVRELFGIAAEKCPDLSMLSIVLYCDEITPGNVISHKNRRKSWAVYFSVLEWGPEILCQEDYRTKPSKVVS